MEGLNFKFKNPFQLRLRILISFIKFSKNILIRFKKPLITLVVFYFLFGINFLVSAQEVLSDSVVTEKIQKEIISETINTNVVADTVDTSNKEVIQNTDIYNIDQKESVKNIEDVKTDENITEGKTNSALDLIEIPSPKNNPVFHPEVDQMTGALNYNYTIQTPKGINNLTPSLVLRYNSQNTNNDSIIGYGWNISIPYIQRRNIHGTDKLYSSNDFLSSTDGELTPVDQNNFAPKTDDGSFHVYSFLNNVFVLKDKLGNTYTYGASINERQDDPSNSNNIYKWMLSSEADVNGNIITYHYFKDNGQIYLDKINYAGIYEISFQREVNPFPNKNNSAGFLIKNNYRINNILIKTFNVTRHSYSINYTLGNNGQRSLISSILEIGYDENGTSTNLSPTIFSWQNYGGGFSQDTNWTMPLHGPSNAHQYSVLGKTISYNNSNIERSNKIIDVNGDGLPDWVETSIDDGTYNGVWLGTSTGWVKDNTWTSIMPRNSDGTPYLVDRLDHNMFHYVMLTDVNGDGLPDWVESNTGGNGNVWLNNGNGWALDSTWLWPAPSYSQGNPFYLRFGDTWDPSNSTNFRYNAKLVDVNNDGLPDVVQSIDNNTTVSSYDHYGVYLNNGHGWVKDTNWAMPVHTVNGNDWGSSLLGSNELLDINGDNLPDWIETQGTVISGPGSFTEYSGVWLNTGHSWVRDLNWTMPYYQEKNQYNILQYHDAPLGYSGSLPNSSIYNFRNGTLVDLNADGLPDWLMTSVYDQINPYTGVGEFNNVWLNTGHGWEKDTSWIMLPPTTSCVPNNCYGYYIGNYNSNTGSLFDINSDGLPDWIETRGNNLNTVYINTGNGWISRGDVTPWHLEYNIYNKGALYGNIDLYNYHPYLTKHRHDIIDDVDGDGLPDWVESTFVEDPYNPPSTADIWYGIWKGNGQVPDLMSSITIPTGGISSFTYKPQIILDANPRENNQTINTVVSINNTDSVNNISSVTNYEYMNGKYYFSTNDNDRKFAGFEKVITVLPDGSKKINYYHQGDLSNQNNYEYNDNSSKIGKIYRTDVTDSEDVLLTRTTTKWENASINSLNNDRYFVYPNQTLAEYFSNTNKTIANQNIYDTTNGNLLSSKNFGEVLATDPLNFTDIGLDQKNVTFNYATDGSGMYNISEEIKTDQNNNVFSDIKHYYDSLSFNVLSKGLESKKEILKTSNVYNSFAYKYDNFGNKISETDSLKNTTSYTYDSYNLYPIKIIDALSHETNISYDYALGKIKSVFNQNGFENQYIYDGIGRILIIKTPDVGSKTTSDPLVISKNFTYIDTPNNISIFETDNFDSSLSKNIYQYFNGFNKIIQTREYTGSQNKYIVSDISYDNMDRIYTVSLPYFDYNFTKSVPISNNNLLTYNTYDPLSRIVNKTNILGTTQNIYDGFKTTTVDALGNIKSNTVDAYGNLINVEENNQGQTYNTYYEYDANNNLIKIKDALGNIRNFVYDNLGNRILAEDLHNPSDNTFGIWKYEYDLNNNLSKIINANGKIIYFKYDKLNRIIKEYTQIEPIKNILDENLIKKTADFERIDYVYDNCSNGIGMLCSVKRSGSSKTDYIYDALGNIKNENKLINNKNYTTENSYNLQGILNKIIYSDNSRVLYDLNQDGLIQKVTYFDSNNNPKILITNIEYNENKIPSVVNYGNGVITNNTFDQSQLYRLIHKETTNSQGLHLQDLSYVYDKVGNILNIVDASNTDGAKNITYTYDDLYRLTQTLATNTVNNQDYTQSFNYDAIGNILSSVFTLKNKTRNTIYNYSTNQTNSYANPHAIISLNNLIKNQNEYDKNGNLIKDNSNIYKWNYRNELSSVTSYTNTNSYLYDETGNRVYEKNNTDIKIYPNRYYEDDGNFAVKYIYAGNLLIASIEKDLTNLTDVYHYNNSDQVYSSTIVSDDTGNIEQTLDYYPYGNIRINSKLNNFSEHKQYGGHYKDETGLNYMGARYYNSNYGRFISIDPMFWTLPKEYLLDPQQMNSYAYARNNPIIYTDPDGKTAVDSINNFINNTLSNVASSVNNFLGGGSNISQNINTEIKKGTDLDYPNGYYIRSKDINITFDKGADNKVNRNLVNYFEKVTEQGPKNGIYSINISSTTNHASNSIRSAHQISNGANALDISTINGTHVSAMDPYSKTLQTLVNNTSGYRENFGPNIMNKIINNNPVSFFDSNQEKIINLVNEHKNHVHISVP